MIYAYCRVSTAHQSQENQRFVIEKFANENNIKIDVWVKETISIGSKSRELKLEKHKKRLEWMLKRGFSKPKIAKLLGVHKCTIYNYLKIKQHTLK